MKDVPCKSQCLMLSSFGTHKKVKQTIQRKTNASKFGIFNVFIAKLHQDELREVSAMQTQRMQQDEPRHKQLTSEDMLNDEREQRTCKLEKALDMRDKKIQSLQAAEVKGGMVDCFFYKFVQLHDDFHKLEKKNKSLIQHNFELQTRNDKLSNNNDNLHAAIKKCEARLQREVELKEKLEVHVLQLESERDKLRTENRQLIKDHEDQIGRARHEINDARQQLDAAMQSYHTSRKEIDQLRDKLRLLENACGSIHNNHPKLVNDFDSLWFGSEKEASIQRPTLSSPQSSAFQALPPSPAPAPLPSPLHWPPPFLLRPTKRPGSGLFLKYRSIAAWNEM